MRQRHPVFAMAVVVVALCAAVGAHAVNRTQNVVLVTLDGVRIQELFGGFDELIAKHSATLLYSEIETTRRRYARATPQDSRAALMPFLWKTLAPNGIVLGNPATGSVMQVRNRFAISSPGYAEMLTGQPQTEIVDNTLKRYPHRTALEHVYTQLGLKPWQVAQIGSWDGLGYAASSRDDAFVMVGAIEKVPPPYGNDEMDYVAGLRRQVMGLWEEGSDDVLTFRIAMSYLRANKPRLLWVGLGNSDDWAHDDRYDRCLDYLHLADSLLGELWQTLQSMEEYRGRTTLIVTTDHGRGRTAADWAEHDIAIPGSSDIWAAVIGPDTAAVGEAHGLPAAHQGQIASTIVELFGLDIKDFNTAAGPALPGSITPR